MALHIKVNGKGKGKKYYHPTDGLHLQQMDLDMDSKDSFSVGGSEGDIRVDPTIPTNEETLLINVGGQIFETYVSTVHRLGGICRLADELFLRAHHRASHGDYFFDRDPDTFKCVLNLLRTGQLHVPKHICGPAIKTELQYWGVDDTDIEGCCWGYYNTWNHQNKTLAKLEKAVSSVGIVHSVNQATASKWQRIQATVWNFLDNPFSSRPSKIYTWISILVVIVSIFSFCAETHPSFQVSSENDILAEYFLSDTNTLDRDRATPRNPTGTGNDTKAADGSEQSLIPHPALIITDFVCLIFFTLEFLVRVTFAPAKLRFLLSSLNVIDCIAIMPDYIELVVISINPDERNAASIVDFIFILRIMRLFRIFRLIRHVPGLWILLFTIRASLNELILMVVFLLIGMVVFASLIYFAEGRQNTDFTNIPIGFWWSIVTMTTVGYGDMHPRTAWGYVIGSLCALIGLLMIAFTVPIVVGNFVLYYTHIQYIIGKKKKLSNRDLGKSEETINSMTHDQTKQTRACCFS